MNIRVSEQSKQFEKEENVGRLPLPKFRIYFKGLSNPDSVVLEQGQR
jgi:hypothetical protein